MTTSVSWNRKGTKRADRTYQYHDEYMRVIEGRLEVTLEGKTFVVTPSDDQVLIPKGQAHSLKSFKGERLVFEERTAPPGDYKAR